MHCHIHIHIHALPVPHRDRHTHSLHIDHRKIGTLQIHKGRCTPNPLRPDLERIDNIHSEHHWHSTTHCPLNPQCTNTLHLHGRMPTLCRRTNRCNHRIQSHTDRHIHSQP